MADLTFIQASTLVSLTGIDSTGLETNPVNADANGNLLVKDYSVGPVTAGAAAAGSSLTGGQFNTTLPTLTNTQQAALQVDASGRLFVLSKINPQEILVANAQTFSAGTTQFGPYTGFEGRDIDLIVNATAVGGGTDVIVELQELDPVTQTLLRQTILTITAVGIYYIRALSTSSGTFQVQVVRISGSMTANISLRSKENSVAQGITDGTSIAAVKAASTAPVAADPAVVVALSPNSSASKLTAIGAAAAGAAVSGNPVLVAGLEAGATARTIRVGEHGNVKTTSDVLLWHDALEGTTVNTFLTQSTTTQTIAQTTGVLTLNNSGITTLNTDSIITSQRQFAKLPKGTLHWFMRANISANAAANHTLVEMGLGAPSGVTAALTNGAFFRWTAAGVLNGVISFNGTEQSTQILAQGVITTTSYYRYDIFVEDDFVRFIITDSAGVPVGEARVQLTLTVASPFAVSHVPSFARVYVDATGGGTAIKLAISEHAVYLLDVLAHKPWQQQMSATMRHATINPTTYAQTGSSMTAAPATETPSNTVGGYNALGGDFATALTTASENPLSVFGFQIPSPYTFYITQIIFSIPFVTTAISVTGIPIIEWMGIANCASANISTGGGQRFPLGLNMVYSSATAAIGTFLTSEGSLMFNPDVPIACLPGTFLHIAYKVFITSAITTAGVTRGSVYIDGYFE